jgi:DNA-binding transcriptional MerR regulator
MEAQGVYSIHELAERFRISPHTIHKYVRNGVLPPTNSTGGPGARPYTRRHVELLELIWGHNGLKDANVTLAEFAERHNGTGDWDC